MLNSSRFSVPTPALVLDLDALSANLAAMASRCRAAGIGLRPHVKSHKSTRIAHLQIANGAVGVCCATVDEAEAMASAAVPGILLTSPIVSEDKIERMVSIASSAPDFSLVADDAGVVAALNQAAQRQPIRLKVIVDLDVGHHRSGVLDPASVVVLAAAIASSSNLVFGGLQAYAGHVQHIEDFDQRRQLATECATKVRAAIAALAAANLNPAIVTGGGTGTWAIEPTLGALTELQAGSYVFMDAEYMRVSLEPDGARAFRPSLFVQATVISGNVKGFVQTDAGTKAFALNGPAPEIVRGAPAGSTYSYLGDEHGRIALPVGDAAPGLGSRVECVTPHCDPTVHLYSVYHCVRGDQLMETWTVDARRK